LDQFRVFVLSDVIQLQGPTDHLPALPNVGPLLGEHEIKVGVGPPVLHLQFRLHAPVLTEQRHGPGVYIERPVAASFRRSPRWRLSRSLLELGEQLLLDGHPRRVPIDVRPAQSE
jgi:hypothetical protein